MIFFDKIKKITVISGLWQEEFENVLLSTSTFERIEFRKSSIRTLKEKNLHTYLAENCQYRTT